LERSSSGNDGSHVVRIQNMLSCQLTQHKQCRP
jgi:hypothetical protein